MHGDYTRLVEETLTEASDMRTANEIAKQLGGALYMMGAKNQVGGDGKSELIGYDKKHRGYLSFDVPKPRGSKITVILNNKDLYDVMMGKMTRDYEWKVTKKSFDVPVENLIPTLEKFTGMAGRL